MPKAKKNVKLRDQKPMKDPKGGGHHPAVQGGGGNKHNVQGGGGHKANN